MISADTSCTKLKSLTAILKYSFWNTTEKTKHSSKRPLTERTDLTVGCSKAQQAFNIGEARNCGYS